MTENERLKKIDDLLNQIRQLNYGKIFLQTKLSGLEEGYFKEFDESKKKQIIETRESLEKIVQDLNPLVKEVNSLRKLYLIEYYGELSIENRKEWHRQMEYLYFNTDYDIDTFKNGWDQYKTDTKLTQLTMEAHNFLFTKFPNLQFGNIKRINAY